MPRYQFQIAKAGLVIPVMVGPDRQTITRAIQAGQPLPRALMRDALIDTGADVTGFTATLIAQLGLPYSRTTATVTASGVATVRLFGGSVGIPPLPSHPSTHQWHPQLEVTELAHSPGWDVLIGMDLICEGLLLIDGSGGVFELAL